MDWSSRDLIEALRADGWSLARVEGSHHQFVHSTKPGRVTVPHPRKSIPTGTVRSIFRQADLNWKERR